MSHDVQNGRRPVSPAATRLIATSSTGRTRTAQPRRPPSEGVPTDNPTTSHLGHYLEIHAVDGGDHRRRHEDDPQHGEQLDDVVLREVDEAEGRVEQELHFLRLEVRVLLKRLQVAQSGLRRLTHWFWRVRGAPFRHQEQHEPLELDQAFAQVRDLLVFPAERAEGRRIDLAPRALVALDSKDLARDGIELVSDLV